jgi:4-hydroxy-3-polyprenylbenzoate decarboxylase
MSVSNKSQMTKILIGVTGASGGIYASRLLDVLSDKVERIYLVCTESGLKVIRHELKKEHTLRRLIDGEMSEQEKSTFRVFSNDDLFAPCASGTAVPDAVVVLPCSMGSLARIAGGISGNLLERAADVALKQKQKLIICPRETPFNLIHLRNMTTLVEAGAEMIPLMPGFYQNPTSIEDLVDFCVGKVCEQLGVSHGLYKPWNSRMM